MELFQIRPALTPLETFDSADGTSFVRKLENNDGNRTLLYVLSGVMIGIALASGALIALIVCYFGRNHDEGKVENKVYNIALDDTHSDPSSAESSNENDASDDMENEDRSHDELDSEAWDYSIVSILCMCVRLTEHQTIYSNLLTMVFLLVIVLGTGDG
jgi:hypothetical protein